MFERPGEGAALVGRLAAIGVLLGTLLLVFSAHSRAASDRPLRVCPTCTYRSVQAALDAASDGDVIAIAPGSYAGGLKIDKSVVLAGAGRSATTISGGESVVKVSAGKVVAIRDLEITGGDAGPRPPGGGGIQNFGTLALTNTVISGNHSPRSGGGIYSEGALSLNASTVMDNTAEFDGPGIFSWGDAPLTIVKSSISGNASYNRPGGGVLAFGPTTIRSSAITGNTSGDGGGGVAAYGALTMIDTVVEDNLTISSSPDPFQAKGGGIQAGSPFVIADSTVAGNTGGYGGGIFVGGTATIRETAVTSNTSLTMGGGIANEGTATLKGSTVTANVAENQREVDEPGGGIYNLGSVFLLFTVVAGNDPDDCAGC